MKKIAIIDNSIYPEIYDPVRHWSRIFRSPCYGFRAKDHQFPGLRQGFSHFILTGSEASIMERENWVDEEMEFTREIVDKGYPVLGSCYGHQLLALALAGPGHVRRSPQPELGWCSIHILVDNELLGKKGRFYAYTLHFDEVIHLGPPFRILASTSSCRIHVFQYGDSPVWGIQAHPEIDTPTGIELFRKMKKVRHETASLYAEALKSDPQDSGKIIQIADVFLNKSAKRL
jgi:GMP synthase-like glutamine amidotransferase